MTALIVLAFLNAAAHVYSGMELQKQGAKEAVGGLRICRHQPDYSGAVNSEFELELVGGLSVSCNRFNRIMCYQVV